MCLASPPPLPNPRNASRQHDTSCSSIRSRDALADEPLFCKSSKGGAEKARKLLLSVLRLHVTRGQRRGAKAKCRCSEAEIEISRCQAVVCTRSTVGVWYAGLTKKKARVLGPPLGEAKTRANPNC